MDYTKFIYTHNMNTPLAERMRPRILDDYIGQEHLVGPDGVLRRMIESGRVASFIPVSYTHLTLPTNSLV